MKKYSQYFNIFKCTNDNPEELISTLRVRYEEKIWEKIREIYLDNDQEYIEKSFKDPYNSMYHLNIKQYIKELFIDVYELMKGLLWEDNINLDDECFMIYLATSGDYRKVNEQFDNEMAFLEYMNSEISEMDKHRYISRKILEGAGFEYLEEESNLGRKTYEMNCDLCSYNYSIYRKWTNDDNPIKLDIDNGQNNRGTSWHLHIDNSDCQTIGSADIDTVWEFNTLMQIFKSKFRL